MEQGVKHGIPTALAALKICSKSQDLHLGKNIHMHAIESGYDSNIYVANNLINMYAKCGSMVDARNIFDNLVSYTVVSWNSLIGGYSANGEGELALQLYAHMQENGYVPNCVTFLVALKACSSSKLICLRMGKMIHYQAAKFSHGFNRGVANALIDMYAKCGSMLEAKHLFNKIMHPDVVSWTTIIMGYAESGESRLALRMYRRMQQNNCVPNRVTFIAVLKALGGLAAKGGIVKVVCLEKAKAVEIEAAVNGSDANIYLQNTLIDVYVKCGSIAEARRVFNKITQPTAVSWNTIILGYAEEGAADIALELYSSMHCTRNHGTFLAALKACCDLASKEEGKQVNESFLKVNSLQKGKDIHNEAAKCGFDKNFHVASSLMDMYAKCGSMVSAQRVFDNCPHHDVVAWTALIMGYAENGRGALALHFFSLMQDCGCIPDGVTIVAALKACGSLTDVCLENLRVIHNLAGKIGHLSNIYVANTLIDMYSKHGSIADARNVFDRMVHHDVVSWNAAIFGYAEHGESDLAFHLFSCMGGTCCKPNATTYVGLLKACKNLAEKEIGEQIEGKTLRIGSLLIARALHREIVAFGHENNIYVATTLVDLYANCGNMLEAQKVFDNIALLTRVPVVLWTAIIMGFSDNGEHVSALQLYSRMLDQECVPNRITFVAALKACGSLAALEAGKKVHVATSNAGMQNDLLIANSLIDFYGKCGSMQDAHAVFDSMKVKDSMSWSALMAGYNHQGDAKRVFDLFDKMRKNSVQPDAITYLSVLSACSHTGNVYKGKEYFQEMCFNHTINVSLDHYTCMVALLGRANHVDAALEMVTTMPFQPNIMIWLVLLTACKKWANVKVGLVAFHSILSFDADNTAANTMMAEIYALKGQI